MTSGPDRYLPTTPGTQVSWSAPVRFGPRARLAHLWHRRHRFSCGYCRGPLLAYVTGPGPPEGG